MAEPEQILDRPTAGVAPTMMRLHVISLGAGVQSTTMALMAAHGEITPMPDCAIFADTQSEPNYVYEHLRWLRSPNVLPFPVHIVTKANLGNDIGTTNEKRRFLKSLIPAYVLLNGKPGGLLVRECTRDYKIHPIIKKVRELAGLSPRQRAPKYPIVEQWIGISLDEAVRMKPSRNAWIQHRWPLIENKMRRTDCLRWLERHGYPKPRKSACTFCPYRSDTEWRELPTADFAAAVVVDRKLRDIHKNFRTKGEIYLHRSCVPLDEVDLSTAEDHGQLNLFNNECEGMCGV
jgi:hypothetical protein